MSMFLNDKSGAVSRKHQIFVMLLIFTVACNSKKEQPQADLENTIPRHAVIDSLLQRIAHDSIALTNYMKLAASNNDTLAEMKTTLAMGNYHRNRYKYESAVQQHEKALTLAELTGDRMAMITANNALARDHEEKGSTVIASDHYYRALTQLEGINPQNNATLERAIALNGLGNIYLHHGEAEKALDYFRGALTAMRELNNREGEAENLLDIGRYMMQTGEADSAYHYFREAMDQYIKVNSLSGMSICFRQIGALYMQEGEPESAAIYLGSAYNTLKETSDRLNLMKAALLLGELSTGRGAYERAASYLQEATDIANELQLPVYQEEANKLMGKLYSGRGNATAALEAYERGEQYARRNSNNRMSNHIASHREQYEKAQNDQEQVAREEANLQLKEKKKRSANIVHAFSLGVAILLLLIFHQYRFRLRQQRASFHLEKQKADFYLSLSHDFKTPVSIISGLTERLRAKAEKRSDEHELVDLEILTRQSENLYMLVDQIASISTVEQQNEEMNIINGNLTAYIHQLYQAYMPLARKRNIRYHFSSNVKELHTDHVPEYLRIIINNLISNAANHTGELDEIEVALDCDLASRSWSVRVSDTGEGISSKELSRVFDLFYRGSNNRSNLMGSGIGLPFSRHLALRMNGTLEVESDPGMKTTFTLTLPLLNERVVDNTQFTERANETPMATPQKALTGENELPRLLIVSGDGDMRHYLSSILHDRYELITAAHGNEAVQMAADSLPKLILADAELHLMNGCDLCKLIKSTPLTAHIPVVLLTLRDTREERLEGFSCGADALIAKPVYEDELMAVITQLLLSRRQIRERYAQIGTAAEKPHNGENIRNEQSLHFLEKVTDMVYRETEHNDNLIERMAGHLCISTSQLNRKIKGTTGLTTSQYILKVRLNKAQKMLTRSQKPIGEIAMECGFNDFAYFSRSFRKEFGMTPTSYQRRPQSVN